MFNSMASARGPLVQIWFMCSSGGHVDKRQTPVLESDPVKEPCLWASHGPVLITAAGTHTYTHTRARTRTHVHAHTHVHTHTRTYPLAVHTNKIRQLTALLKGIQWMGRFRL